jgi:predicted Zn-dependent protease
MTLPRHLRHLLVVILLAFALGACAKAPGTGRTIFTGGLSEQDERRLGAQEHPKILAEFGGAYGDPELAAYVDRIGDELVAISEQPNLDFTFTVLDTPIINAFALPGGYVYVTRGLVELANDEAELAGVMAHEIGHVTARHSAERYGSNVAATIANIGVAILAGGQAAQASSTATALALQSYSRDQELEADTLGVRYLARNSYDPEAMASFLESLQAHSRLEAELAGNPGAADRFNIMQTHPRTRDRIEQAIQRAAATDVTTPQRLRDRFLRAVDGAVYGDSREQGFVRGNAFLHPVLGFAFEAPRGFRLTNTPGAVVGAGPGGARMVFEGGGQFSGAMQSYVSDQWARGTQLRGLRPISQPGVDGATALAQVRTNSGQLEARIAALRTGQGQVYRLIYAAPNYSGRDDAAFLRSIESFRLLSDAEAAALSPYRIAIHSVQPGDTPASLAERFPYDDGFDLKRFLVLNGLGQGAALTPGQPVKLVVE